MMIYEIWRDNGGREPHRYEPNLARARKWAEGYCIASGQTMTISRVALKAPRLRLNVCDLLNRNRDEWAKQTIDMESWEKVKRRTARKIQIYKPNTWKGVSDE